MSPFTDARFATWLIKHFQIPIRGIRNPTGVFAVPAASLSSSPDTQRMPVPYPPNLESAAAPATLAQVLIAEVGADSQSARGKPISSGDADDPAPARSRLGACNQRFQQ